MRLARLRAIVAAVVVAAITACSAERPAPARSPTAAASPSRPPEIVVAAAGDIACSPMHSDWAGGQGVTGACRQQATSDVLVSLDPDVVLALGDLQYERGTLEMFRTAYVRSWGRLLDRTRPAVGNHEYGTRRAAGYFDYFGERAGPRGRGYYSFDVDGWHVVALNSNCAAVPCAAGSAQDRWLAADLAAHPARCTLAFLHHPRVSSGLHGDTPAVAPLFRRLHAAGVDLLLAGHDHHYERFTPLDADGRPRPTGLRQFIVGTGGRSLYPIGAPRPGSEVRHGRSFGVLELKLSPTGYAWRFVPIAGGTFSDAGSARCA